LDGNCTIILGSSLGPLPWIQPGLFGTRTKHQERGEGSKQKTQSGIGHRRELQFPHETSKEKKKNLAEKHIITPSDNQPTTLIETRHQKEQEKRRIAGDGKGPAAARSTSTQQQGSRKGERRQEELT